MVDAGWGGAGGRMELESEMEWKPRDEAGQGSWIHAWESPAYQIKDWI